MPGDLRKRASDNRARVAAEAFRKDSEQRMEAAQQRKMEKLQVGWVCVCVGGVMGTLCCVAHWQVMYVAPCREAACRLCVWGEADGQGHGRALR